MPGASFTCPSAPLPLLFLATISTLQAIAAPVQLSKALQARADDKDSDDSDAKDSKDASSNSDDGTTKEKLTEYSSYAIGGMPLYIWLLIATGAMIVCFGIFWWWRTQKKLKKQKEEDAAKAEEQEKQDELERQNGGVPNPNDEFEGDDDGIGQEIDGYPDEKSNPDFLQIQNQQHH